MNVSPNLVHCMARIKLGLKESKIIVLTSSFLGSAVTFPDFSHLEAY